MTIEEGSKPYNGVNKFLIHYQIRCDPNIGLGRCERRRIPCDCTDLINSMDLLWDTSLVKKYQPIYYSVTKCKYYPI